MESPKTRDSSIAYETSQDTPLDRSRSSDEQGDSLGVPTPKMDNGASGEPQIPSKVVVKMEVDDHSNEFVYHRDDRRNRHGVSFKVCKNKDDGAIVRPKLPSKSKCKKEIHSKMLNENNDAIKSTPRVEATKQVMEEFHENEKEGKTVRVVEKDMYEQESALKIRLLKRENQLNKKRKGDSSGINSDSMNSSSPKKNSFEKEPNF